MGLLGRATDRYDQPPLFFYNFEHEHTHIESIMGVDKRTFIVSNLHRDELSDINNDVNITLPNSIFSGKVDSINLKHLFIDYEYEIIGTSNYEFSIAYPSTNNPVSINLAIDKTLSYVIQSDDELAILIADSINNTLGTVDFQVYHTNVITYHRDVYRDNSDLLSNYTIFTSSGVQFTIDFSAKSSLGPLIGFGNNIYTGESSYKSGNVPPIYAYESIRISNKAYDTTFKQYDQSTDIACKMDLYDSSGALITNHLDTRDTTISLPIVDGYLYNVREFITYLEAELNIYSSAYAGNPTFTVGFDHTTYKFTITTDKNVLFGIGFRFDRGDGRNNYGSLHRHLGFSKNIYQGITTITSTQPAAIFERAYVAEYLFVCSDLIKYNYDASLIVTESQGNATFYESLFAIPTNQIINNAYSPVFNDEHRVRIHASLLAKKYNEALADSKTINFYLKTSSGRHIKLNTQWSLKFEIEYNN